MSTQERERKISMQNLQMSLIPNNQPQEDQQQNGFEGENQIVYENGSTFYENGQKEQVPNLIRNQKYSVITFIPVVLYEQFKYFFNMFYLLTALSQFVPVLKVGLMFSFVAPLVLVLSLTMMKQAYEDYQRFLKDKQINSAKFTVQTGNGQIIKKSSELKVGDIIQVSSGQNVPADCLILKTFSDKPSIFIKTDQLDGQTDWKLRKAIVSEENMPSKMNILFQNPQINIYQFVGSFQVKEQDFMGLSLQNTAWRGVKVASGKCLMLVIYTGKETKLSLNMKQSSTKFGKLDLQLNFYSKILFTVMVFLSFMLICFRGFTGTGLDMFILFFKYFLLLSSIIPISMRVNLDFAKLVYKYFIDHDTQMTDSLCRNSSIPEELGRIDYILSDKTGTLTQNEMIFKKLFIQEDCKYESDDTTVLQEILNSQLKPCQDLFPNTRPQRTYQQITRDTITALMVCHNVTPVIDNGEQGLQGSSPDEITLVSFAQSLGYKLQQRTQDYIKLKNPKGQYEEYQILNLFPFTSQTKRMGIIVKDLSQDKLVLYLKGADTVIEEKISHLNCDFMLESCSDLAREGLRTLVITEKVLSEEYYEGWKKQYDLASAALKDRQEKVANCRKKLQVGMMFLGVTGVEDKLQQKVVETVGSARSIGIKVWMLTGDKVQTAICVGRAVRLIQGREELLYVIENVKSVKEFHEKLHGFYEYANINSHQQLIEMEKINCVLVIDGNSLKFALSQIQQQFFNIAVKLPAIICSRVSPTQKAEIASLVIKYSKSQGRVLGIGDGGNDVALIQSAHVGIGIYGKQGIQAALASDFSIGQFKDLNELMYWHGRLSYKRSSLLAQFIIHRGVIITLMQSIFIIQFYFVPLPIYSGFLLLGYSTVFTVLPVFSLILDQDISRKIAQKYPILYKSTTEGQLSLYSFLYWMFISFYQGTIIMVLISVVLMYENFYMITTVSFTCLIIIEFLNVFTDIHKLHYLQIVSTLLSIGIYTASIFLMKNIINGPELFSTKCLPITILIVLIAWGPPFIYETVKRLLYPTEEQKIMKQAQSLIF